MPHDASSNVRSALSFRPVVRAIAVTALVWGAATARPAVAAVTLTQITHGGGFEPSISANGNTIVFDSNLDLAGQNASGAQQIFSYDVALQSFTQITHTTAVNKVFNFAPVADDHGGKIAYFVDRLAKKGERDPVFVFDRMTNTATKVANDARSAQRLALSGNGSELYFISQADLVPGGNSDHNDELFRFRTTTQTMRQMTSTTSPFPGITKFDPWVSRDGKRFAVASTDDLAGNGANDSGEVFFGMLPQVSSLLQQITPNATTSGFSDEVSISADGKWMTFRSSQDLVSGQNSDHNEEIFLFSLASSTLTQVTNTIPSDSANNVVPVVNQDGTRILFASTGNLQPAVGNLDHNFELFVFDKTGSTFTQITNTVPPRDNLGQGSPSFSADGTRAVFVSDADLVPGQNTAHNFEVFLANVP